MKLLLSKTAVPAVLEAGRPACCPKTKITILLALFLTASLAKAAAPFDWNSETIHCGNLVYGENKTAICFAEKFLSDAATETGLRIAPKFRSIFLSKDEVFTTPFCIFTGQGDFKLGDIERNNLRRYLENGGFVLASPGCSDQAWNKAFAREIQLALPAYGLKQIPMSHELFSTVNKITSLTVKGRSTSLQGISINGRLAMVYSPEGLNDASNAQGCCCCGGAEISQSREINVNAIAYSLLH